MVDVLRKHVAPQHRVLVDGKAFLNTQINAAVLYFTPGQIELMRNLMQYANRRTTWVSDYYIGYYLSPTDEDWDLIQREVADLEDTLMGNNNVIWGYRERWAEDLSFTMVGSGGVSVFSTAVPEGEVWVLEAASIRNTDGLMIGPQIGVLDVTYYCWIAYEDTVPQMRMLLFEGRITLAEGDKVRLFAGGIDEGDEMEAAVRGYKMDVPTT